ncbi:MAG: nicotinate-nucleotide--dimethylbenzimidazole phosphoribosyltransferase, partial [bacterium]|nr:nicotinate-nucleotide--dimethylbenzimidazole phosphoribosyltransferase [bacterium]
MTKPPGSLGRLEEIVTRFALLRGKADPRLSSKALYIFCADHGVAASGVSAYPSEVTGQMVGNLVAGGAAINVLCHRFAIEPMVVDVGVRGPADEGVITRKIGEGTANFTTEPAMTREQAEQAIETGRELACAAAANYEIACAG